MPIHLHGSNMFQHDLKYFTGTVIHLRTTLKPKKAISAFGNYHELLQVHSSNKFFTKLLLYPPSSLSNPQGLYHMVYKCMECAGGKNPNRTGTLTLTKPKCPDMMQGP